jgi:hypothetical protein
MDNLNINGLVEIFNKNLYDEYLYNSLNKIMSYDIEKTKEEMNDLKNELLNYENRFKKNSAEFYEEYSKGKLEDNAEFFEWSALYQMYIRTSSRLRYLTTND